MEMEKVKNTLRPGDIVRVSQKVLEGDKERIQVVEGTIIARKHGNEPGATITVRKIASGVGVEFVFPLNSPKIQSFELIRHSKVRRAKLYYLRKLSGKAGRVKEDLREKSKIKKGDSALTFSPEKISAEVKKVTPEISTPENKTGEGELKEAKKEEASLKQ